MTDGIPDWIKTAGLVLTVVLLPAVSYVLSQWLGVKAKLAEIKREGLGAELDQIATYFKMLLDLEKKGRAEDMARLHKEIGSLSRQVADTRAKEQRCQIRLARMEEVMKAKGLWHDDERDEPEDERGVS